MDKQEPVAYIYEFWADRGHKGLSFTEECSADNTPLYTTPQTKEWVGLTDEEVTWLCNTAKSHEQTWGMFVRAIEAKLKEKNT